MSCVVLSKIPTTACGLLCITAPKREVVLLHSCRQSQERRAAEYRLSLKLLTVLQREPMTAF